MSSNVVMLIVFFNFFLINKNFIEKKKPKRNILQIQNIKNPKMKKKNNITNLTKTKLLKKKRKDEKEQLAVECSKTHPLTHPKLQFPSFYTSIIVHFKVLICRRVYKRHRLLHISKIVLSYSSHIK